MKPTLALLAALLLAPLAVLHARRNGVAARNECHHTIQTHHPFSPTLVIAFESAS
jgi:hypothetical protein